MGTTTLNRSLLVDVSLMGIKTDTLGAGTGEVTSDADVGKAVKMAAASYVGTVVGEEIEGFITSVEPGTRNSGYSWGGIQTTGRKEVTVAAAQTGTVVVGQFVASAGTQAAFGTAGDAQVFTVGTGYVAPSDFMWRVIRIVTGTGVAGDTILIERI